MDLATTITQFGAAGLIAWMWLSERRHGALRERQIAEAHERLLEHRLQLDLLVDVVRDNTRAMSALEAGQRRIADLLDRLRPTHAPTPAPAHPATPVATTPNTTAAA